MKKTDKFIGKSGEIVELNITGTVNGIRGGKKNPYVGNVTKTQTGAIVRLGGQGAYELEMKEKVDENFKVGKAKWGVRRADSCILDHKDNVYVDMFFIEPGIIQYWYEGKEIKKEDIEGLPETTRTDQEKKGVVYRKMKLDGVEMVDDVAVI